MGVQRADKATQIDDPVQWHDIFILLKTGHDAYSLARFIERWCVLDGYTLFCSGVSTFSRAGQGVAMLVADYLLLHVKLLMTSQPGSHVHGGWVQVAGGLVGLDSPFVLGAVYVSPVTRSRPVTHAHDAFATLVEEVAMVLPPDGVWWGILMLKS
jgi:hypothetical protein